MLQQRLARTLAPQRAMAHDAGMRLLIALLVACWPLAAATATPAADALRVYRCVGSDGTVALQDRPCHAGRQQVLDLQRPKDPPARQPRSDDSVVPAPHDGEVVREIRYVQVQPPQPMYECLAPDGERYVSDSSEGNPRWVPVWTSAWLPGGQRPWPGRHGLPPVRGEALAGAGSTSVVMGRTIEVPAGNVLVRDPCQPLPPQETCARLRDQRWALIRRYNSALQGERDALSREQRGLDARLDKDCGGT